MTFGVICSSEQLLKIHFPRHPQTTSMNHAAHRYAGKCSTRHKTHCSSFAKAPLPPVRRRRQGATCGARGGMSATQGGFAELSQMLPFSLKYLALWLQLWRCDARKEYESSHKGFYSLTGRATGKIHQESKAQRNSD
ncbi:hypothetical protein CgunFtcFv8_008936 [Champsocephalus gunnari]|uniref:Uncharacterized protein n=1 Tax=Champsocephalus gunnari TaxID=52237 RepID=A0AAN8HGI4_CHAGU|nr:hypothetical protein CgunFtcFv8_008936 [Champsocephalus gunnari]